MGANLFESGIRRTDAVRLSCHERVYGNRHHAPHGFALAVQRIELARLNIASNSSTDAFISKLAGTSLVSTEWCSDTSGGLSISNR